MSGLCIFVCAHVLLLMHIRSVCACLQACILPCTTGQVISEVCWTHAVYVCCMVTSPKTIVSKARLVCVFVCCLFVIMSGFQLMHVCLILLFVACAKVTVVLSVCTIQMSVCSTN